MIYVESKKKSMKTLLKKYPNAKILDVTSKGNEPWVKVSPFYPHGGIPVPPYPSNHFAESVEGIWQGLKVFESEDIDVTKFTIKNMKGIKRTVRTFGKPLGHRKGVDGTELLDYLTARKEIYLRAYRWVLDNKANDTIQLLKSEAEKQDLVLLDFDTNGDIDNINKPLSHAALVKRYLEKKYPELATANFKQPKKDMSQEIGEFILKELTTKLYISITDIKKKFKLKNNTVVKNHLINNEFEVFKQKNTDMVRLKKQNNLQNNQLNLFD